MSSFSLELQFQEDSANCACDSEWLKTTVAPVDNLDKLMIVEVESVSLFMFQELESSQSLKTKIPETAAIFVPPSLIDTWLEEQNFSIDHEEASSLCCICKNIEIGIQMKLLTQIHHLIGREKCLIRSLVRSRGTEHRPRTSDILLLDISRCQEGWLDTMREICGQPMSGMTNFVIKSLLISVMTVSSPKQTSNSVANNNVASLIGPRCEIPTCAVCLHRIYSPRLGMPKPRNDQLCSEYCTTNGNSLTNNNHSDMMDSTSFATVTGGVCNEAFLKPWPLSSQCKACYLIHNYWSATNDARRNELDDVFCYSCALQETLWICLICGFVGCGRYSQAHAAEHFQETKHAFSLEMATLRTWDYATGEFAHRGDLLECPSVRRHHPQLANVALPWEDDNNAKNNGNSIVPLPSQGPTPKKASMAGEEYEALIQSALEDQAQHYEGEISRLRATLTAKRVDTDDMSLSETHEIERMKSEIQSLRDQVESTQRNLLDMQAQEAGHRAASQRLLQQQNIAKGVLDMIRKETEKEQEQGKLQMEDLEQQIADLTANLRMRHQIAQDEELNNAHIYGTVPTTSKPKRSGKKSRRNGRR